MKNIRNFSIIAHIDHGKSTLSDRMLEVTGTIDKRVMQDQVLDSMELERERGITIKMQPVRMKWGYKSETYILNLIDTPGHIDFSYEVSRAIQAVEGSLLLVDATQGVQAQTFTVLGMARKNNLKIIPVVTKADSPLARIDDITLDLCQLLDCSPDDVITVSGKTGMGVSDLLDAIIERIPAPVSEYNEPRALVFDYEYSSHQGIIVYARMIDGQLSRGDNVSFRGSSQRFTVVEVGHLTPKKSAQNTITAGEIGYIVTGIKDAAIAAVGDTITRTSSQLQMLPGYQSPTPMIWASVYPESQDDFVELRSALHRLKLSDSSLSFEEETSGILGRGFRCGFLGMLHLEIIIERLKREYDIDLILTQPTVTYRVTKKSGEVVDIYNPHALPEHGDIDHIEEPWVLAHIIAPSEYMGDCIQLLHEFESDEPKIETLYGGGTIELVAAMPLRELMRNFFDALKSATSGFASLSYTPLEYRVGDVVRLDVLVGEELQPAFTKVISVRKMQHESEEIVEKLQKHIPQQLIVVKIQARVNGRIVASRSISALRKDVTGYLYGGDISRKQKLWAKQKEGKKKMQARGKVDIPQDVFLKMMK
jgi:GTP-binding protein LepA